MKNQNRENLKIKKQLMSGAVYIALAVTVVAVTISTITATFSDEQDDKINLGEESKNNYQLNLPNTNLGVPDNTEKPVSDTKEGVDAKYTEENKDKDQDNQNAMSGTELAAPSGDLPEKPNPVPAVPDKTKPQGEEPAEPTFELGYNGYIKPVSGYVSKEFSLEVPVYSATMYDYRTHSGIDIACEIGTPVKAVTNGVIRDVYNDYMMGTTVVIEHADGICSVYSGLSPDLPAETIVGKTVKTGEIIAGAGNSAISEVSEASHLHFEIIKDNKNIDPAEFLKI